MGNECVMKGLGPNDIANEDIGKIIEFIIIIFSFEKIFRYRYKLMVNARIHIFKRNFLKGHL